MKGLATINIQQYERTLRSLEGYFYTIELGLTALLGQSKNEPATFSREENQVNIGAIIIGSDQGMVGRFNEEIVQFAKKELVLKHENLQIWPIGEIVYYKLIDAGIEVSSLYAVPDSSYGVTSVVGELLKDISDSEKGAALDTLYLIYNSPDQNKIFIPTKTKLLPIDDLWISSFCQKKWPTNKFPQVLVGEKTTFSALIQEYIFVQLFKVCMESMASENNQRLHLMEKAEKKIEDLLEELNRAHHKIRQDSIDQELFDIIAEFEALVGDQPI